MTGETDILMSARHRIVFRNPEAKTYDFPFALGHYNIYPWIREGDTLVRVLRLPLSNSPTVSRIVRTSAGLCVDTFAKRALSDADKSFIRARLGFCLGVSDDYKQLARASRNDRVLAAALRVNRGIRPKRYADIFEAVCGAICAQNVDFRRLYQMMELLARRFGPPVKVGSIVYYGFPLSEEIAKNSVDDIRLCKVGYRAARILKAAQWFETTQVDLSRASLLAADREEAISRVCSIPGIGPYSAAIVLSAGYGRRDLFQLDSFTRYILVRAYFRGKTVSEKRLRVFVDRKWPGYGGAVAHLLTTNTEVWARQLGFDDFRRSGAATV